MGGYNSGAERTANNGAMEDHRSDDAEQKGLALAESMNKNHVAMQGLGNVFTSAFAPVLKAVVDDMNGLVKAFIESYNSGGAAKVVMDRLADAMKALYSGVIIVVTGIKLFEQETVIFGNAFRAVFDEAARWVESLGNKFPILGKIVDAVVGGVVKAFDWVIDKIKDIAGALEQFLGNLPVVGGAFRALTGAIHQSADTAVKDWTEAGKQIKGVWSEIGSKAELPKAGKGTTAADPGAKPKKEKSGGKGRMAELQTEFETEEAAHKGMLTNMLADELAYWKRVFVFATLSKEQRIEVAKKIATETRALDVQNVTEAQAAAKREAEETVAGINRTLSAKKSAIAELIRLTEDQSNRGEISRVDEHAKIRQLIADEVAAEEDAAHKIAAARVAADKVIIASSMANTKQYKEAMADLVNQFGVYQDAMTRAATQGDEARLKDAQKTTDETVAKWTAATKGIVDTWVSGTRQMLQGTMTFQQFEMKVWNQFLDGVVTGIEKTIQKWITGEATKSAATAAGNAARTAANATAATTGAALDFAATLKSVTNDAVKAASGAYAAMAGIPIVGPALGAAAAGATFVAVEAFGAMASASGGYDIPSGVNPVTQLHAQEMVLPATLANPLRSMLAGGADGFAGSVGGEVHAHFHVNGAMDGPSFKTFLRTNSDHLQTVIGEMVRGGKAPRMGLAVA